MSLIFRQRGQIILLQRFPDPSGAMASCVVLDQSKEDFSADTRILLDLLRERDLFNVHLSWPEYKELLHTVSQRKLPVPNHHLVTLWYREQRDDKGNKFWDFNHLFVGLDDKDHPTSKVPEHDKLWKGGRWTKVTAVLRGNKLSEIGKIQNE